ncbi:MAG: hypothetical protein IPK07_12855 [Deltaproteobacteria bacterium]|nr:hypothetical protein [Deltaproteobacteria bacterium]
MSMVDQVGEFSVRPSESSMGRSVAMLVAGLGALIGGGGLVVGDVEWWSPYALAALLMLPALVALRRARPAGGGRRYALAIVSFLVAMGLVGWWLDPRHPAGAFYLLYGTFVLTGVALMREFRAQVATSVGVRAGAVVVAALGALIAGGGMLQGSVNWWAPYLLASLLLVPSLVVLYWIRPVSGTRRYAVAVGTCLGSMALVGWLADPLRPAASSYILFWPLVCIGVVLAWRSLLSALSG